MDASEQADLLGQGESIRRQVEPLLAHSEALHRQSHQNWVAGVALTTRLHFLDLRTLRVTARRVTLSDLVTLPD